MKTVMITGASSGIGYASAVRLAQNGFQVFAGVRKREDADRLRSEAEGKLTPVEIDVTDDQSIRACVVDVTARLGGGGLDGLVNNAGIGVTGPIEYISPKSLRHQFDVNVFGQIAVTQAFLPLVRRARGRIVNMGSVGSHISIPFGGALSATKSAFRSLNDALRMELHPFGIHVSMIEPASINTPAVDKTLGHAEEAIAELPPEGIERYGAMMREFIRRAIERERGGSSPDVVAAAVLAALTDERPRARYLVGKDSTLLTFMPWLLPDGLLDRIRYRLFGLPAKFAASATP